MPYDPVTGQWTDEDLEVSTRLTGLLKQDNPYLAQAVTEGKKAAHRRGLLNSSIAVSAIEDSRIRAALPIASQESSQANQRYTQGRDIQAAEQQQRRGLRSTEALTREGYGLQRELQAGDIASRERMQSRDIEANRANLERELGSRAALQAAQAAAEKDRLGMQLTAQERLSLQELQAAERRLGLEISSQERMQEREASNQRWMAQFDAATQERLQGLDLATRERMQQAGFTQEQVLQSAELAARERMQGTEVELQRWMATLDSTTRQAMQALDLQTQNRIANMNVASADREAAARVAVSFETIYAGMVESITNNPEIPADARQAYLDHAATMRESNMALLEQFFGVDLEWQEAA